MNNTINSVNNVSFNARYLKLVNPEKFPQSISDAIYKSDAVDEFLKAGTSKTLWGKFIDLFRKKESLDVKYEILKISDLENKYKNKQQIIECLLDPYQKVCRVLFEYNKRNGEKQAFDLLAEQSGIMRKQGSVPKNGEHYSYKPPFIKAEDKLVGQIIGIKDLDKLLK